MYRYQIKNIKGETCIKFDIWQFHFMYLLYNKRYGLRLSEPAYIITLLNLKIKKHDYILTLYNMDASFIAT